MSNIIKLEEIVREIKKPTPIDTTKTNSHQQIMTDKRPSPLFPPNHARDDGYLCPAENHNSYSAV